MNFEQRFWAAWDRHLSAMSHHAQAAILSNPGGYDWRQLAAMAALDAE